MKCRRSTSIASLALLVALAPACGTGENVPAAVRSFVGAPRGAATAAPEVRLRFTDVTAQAGLSFRHENGAGGRKYLPETMGSGVTVLDADGDGWPDLYFACSVPWPGTGRGPAPTGALYRNCGDGTFAEVTAGAGLDTPLFGMGAAAGDCDADGDADLLLTSLHGNRLMRNDGGRFTDVTAEAGVGGGTWRDGQGREHPEWSSSAAFFDADGDGDLDLFVANYVRWSVETDVFTTLDGRTKAYTTPTMYPGLRPRLFLNRGDGTFTDGSAALAMDPQADPKSLGVLVTDFDRDGRPDVFVANDTQPNQLFRNLGDGRFVDVALKAGVAFDETGRARAGMGVGETVREGGQVAVAVGNFSREAVAFFERFPAGLFVDRAAPCGLGAATMPVLTFGLVFGDFDLDGQDDLVLANGHLEPSIAGVQHEVTYAQPLQIFLGVGRRFADASALVGPDFARPRVGRGLASLDYDRDGDPDLVVTENGGPAALLRNDRDPGRRHLRVVLAGRAPNTAAVGAAVTVRAGGRERTATVRSGGSYLSQSEFALTFGLGAAEVVERVAVRWPGGPEQVFEGLPAGREVRLTEGSPAFDVTR